ncbi:toxin-activating lysine-acyltransferase [Shimia sp. R11_0]|nr:toxin-activating lysine-acyltransferase [Shimia sp. R11_0]MBO9477221.1 toxin-activating lysine-acyltransferase [Shimia sp. R11_0]
MGQVTWLMTMSAKHRDRPISILESHLSAPLMFRQVRVFMKEKQPIAAIVWAYASDEVKARVEGGALDLGLEDWRSGPHVVVIDCISPFADEKLFVEGFLSQVAEAQNNSPEE